MIKIVKQKHPWRDDIGDVLQGTDYPKCLFTPDMVPSAKVVVGLPYAAYNPWKALERVNVDPEPLKTEVEYPCSFVEGNRYWMFMPNVILAKDLKPYAPPGYDPKNYDKCVCMFLALALDSDWTKSMYFGLRSDADTVVDSDHWPPALSSVARAMRGHGYTYCTLPDDGHGRWKLVCLELDNGDLLTGWIWAWYNK